MINMENTKKRLANLDLLKVVSMIMIVCLHYLGHGGILKNATLTDGNYYVAWLFEILSHIAVNCFVLCSGYLMAKNRFKFSKLIYLWLQIVSINVIFLILSMALGYEGFSLKEVVKTFLPIQMNAYWFMTSYFAFYLLSPLLIWIANKLTVNQLKKLVITLIAVFVLSPWQWTGINNGYSFVWFAVLFFVAAYIRRADLFNKKPNTYLSGYLIITLAAYTLKIASEKITILGVLDSDGYNSIFCFLTSLFFFATFKNIHIDKAKVGGFISFLSSLTLGVYLFHENNRVREILWMKVVQPLNVFDKPYFVFHMIGCVLGVFFICAFLEYARQLLFKLFNIPSLCDKLGDKVQGVVDKVFNSNFIEKM